MQENVCRLLICFLLFFSSASGRPTYGYISTCSYNIGDDMQSLAAKQLLDNTAIAIDREFVGVFTSPSTVCAIVNGWFMHTKDFCWYRVDKVAPEKSWPPSPSIDPLLVSIHLAEGFIPYAFSKKAVNYLRKHAPVGARDLNTLKELQQRRIPCYFSGCLTLTLNNDWSGERDDIIYAVDVDKECIDVLQSMTSSPIEMVTHIISQEMALDPLQRERYLHALLEKYKKAKCVITVRLHAAMPCLALETPVFLISEKEDKRFYGLRDLVYGCSRDEFLCGAFDYEFDQPPENPREYLALRSSLLETVTDWLSATKRKYHGK